MSRDAVIESWLASMSKSELIDQCFLWQDMALEHGRMYNAVKDENAKLRELALGLKWCGENYGCENLCPLYDKSEPEHCREERLLRELGVEVD